MQVIDYAIRACLILLPLEVGFVVALVTVGVAERVAKKAERAKRRAEHRAQADADMCELHKVYTEVLIGQIMKEDMYEF